MSYSEERRRELLSKGWNADVAEPCEECDGQGHVTPPQQRLVSEEYEPPEYEECPRCLGTGVQR